MSEWTGYIIENFQFEFASGSRVLDLGSGEGTQMSILSEKDIWTCGVDLSIDALQYCRKRDFAVVQNKGEKLPFLQDAFDGVICKVVLPYTNEHVTISEIGRVLRPRGTAYIVSHGAGYYLRYLLATSALGQ